MRNFVYSESYTNIVDYFDRLCVSVDVIEYLVRDEQPYCNTKEPNYKEDNDHTRRPGTR